MSDAKRYIIRKYVTAESARAALEKEPPVADVYVDESAANKSAPADAIGFKYVPVDHLFEA